MFDRELKKGSAELLILSLVEHTPRHGYDIAQLIEARSDGVIQFKVASLYPLLYRLEARGWIQGRWVEKPGQRRRRYYRLTADGPESAGRAAQHLGRICRRASRGVTRATPCLSGEPKSGRGLRRCGCSPAQETAIAEELAQDAEDRSRGAAAEGGLRRRRGRAHPPGPRRDRQLRATANRAASRCAVTRAGLVRRIVPRRTPGRTCATASARFARARSLPRSAILTLTLGIGASTAMFSVLNAVLIVPLPFPEPDRLVQIWGARRDVGWQQASLSHANFWDIADLARDFTEIGGMTFTGLNLTGREAPRRVGAAQVSVGFLRALGVTPVAGRFFVKGEDQAGHDNAVVVLSNRFWQSRFGGQPDVDRPDGNARRKTSLIVGVLPEGTPLLDAGDVFIPLVRTAKEDRDSMELGAVGRLRPGVTRRRLGPICHASRACSASAFPTSTKASTWSASPRANGWPATRRGARYGF